MSRQFVRLKGIHFSNPALPVIGLSSTEKLIASLPGLRVWMDPQAKFEPAGSGEGLRDRQSLYDSVDYANHHYTLDGAIGGQPTVSLANAAGQGVNWSNPADFRFIEQGYTIFVVAKKTQALTTLPLFAFDGGGATVRFRLTLRGTDDRLELRHSATDAGYTAASFATDTNPHIYMGCWDAQTGIATTEVDGVAKALNDNTLSTPTNLASAASVGFGTVNSVGTAADSSLGYLLVLDRPYSKAAYTAQKKALLSALGSKYGIAVTV